MARVPDAELARLKREVSVQRLAEARGIELKGQGNNFIGLCPFHEDTSPSLVINPKKNVWNCLGGCQTGGSVIDWVMRAERVSFRHAVEILRADYPGMNEPLPGNRSGRRRSTQKLPEVLQHEADDGELRTQVAMYYHETLKREPEAMEYLARRGLRSSEMIERFKLGFSNRTLGYHLPKSYRKNGKAIRRRLQELGIIKETGHELMRGSVVIPIFDGQGQVVQMYGRKVRDHLVGNPPKHLYLPGPRHGVWNLEALAATKEVILCESLIDALTFWCAGYQHVSAAFGVNGFTQEHEEALNAYGIERVLIAYDRDDAGGQAAARLAERLGAEGISCFRVMLPRGMDVNEYAQKVTPAAQSLGVLLRSAEYMAGPLSQLSVVSGGLPEPPARPADPEEQEPAETEPPAAAEPALPLAAEPEAVEAPAPAVTEAQASEERTPAPASPVPPAPAPFVDAEVCDHEVNIRFGDRRWRVRGLSRNLSFEQLRINLLVAQSSPAAFHVDSLDLYSARQRGIFLKQASEELQVKQEVLKRDLGKVLLKLEQLQEEQIRRTLEPKEEAVVISEAEKAEAMQLLQDAKLLERVSSDFETCGLVGEHTNKLVGYLTAVSRKLSKPLAVMVQSSSAAGKSALMEAVLALMPEEERVQYSAMTGQSLFYMGEADLKHKVLAIAEEEGAERASYPLKLLQSEGELTIASTGKDPKSGRLTTHEYHVEGPTAILLTTTAIDLDEELQNRCIVLAVDESREQTEAIHRMQRLAHTLKGLEKRYERGELLKLHQNAQRLLMPLDVDNVFAEDLSFLNDTTRTRRDHEKYLILIDAIALLHQHQREVKSREIRGRRVDYVEATLSDIAMANRLANDALGRTLDELPPQTRRLLFLIDEMVKAACEERQIERKYYRFTRRQVREHTGWGLTQVRLHLKRLVEMEYLIVHRGGRGQSFVYELLYDGEGKDGEPFVLGLINVEKLQRRSKDGQYDQNLAGSESNLAGFQTDLAGSEGNLAGSNRGQIGGVAGGWRSGQERAAARVSGDFEAKSPKNTHQGSQEGAASYRNEAHRSAAEVAAVRRGE